MGDYQFLFNVPVFYSIVTSCNRFAARIRTKCFPNGSPVHFHPVNPLSSYVIFSTISTQRFEILAFRQKVFQFNLRVFSVCGATSHKVPSD